MGFFVENFREELSDKQAATELAKKFYVELLNDSISLQNILEKRYQKDTALYHLKNYVLDSSLENVSNSYIRNYIIGIHTGWRFQPTVVILDKLKNSGSLQYFKSKKVQELTGDLSASIELIKQRHDFELEFAKDYLIPFIVTHNDQAFFARVSNSIPLPFRELSNGQIIKKVDSGNVTVAYEINNLSTFKRQDVYNMLWQYRNVLMSSNYLYVEYQEQNHTLLKLLRKEYAIGSEKVGTLKEF